MFFSHSFVTNYQLLKIACVSVTCLLAYFFVRHFLNLRYYSKIIPSEFLNIKYLLQSIIRFVIEPIQAKHFNGYSLMTVVFELFAGINLIFQKESLYSIWVFYYPLVCANKPETIKEVLGGTKLLEKAWFYKWAHCWLGTGLLTSHGQKWRNRRKLLTPAFHFDILKDFLSIINEKSFQLVKKLEKETLKDYVDVTNYISLCSLDVICETTLGVNINAQENSESEYIKAVRRTTDRIANRFINGLQWFDWLFFLTPDGRKCKKDIRLLHDFTRKVIQEKKAEMLSRAPSSGERRRKPLIDVLLEHHLKTKDLTEEDIREEVDTFTFEGHDTTAIAMTWTLYLIGLYPHVQIKLHEEIRQVFGSDTERPVTNDDLRDLKYLECVLKESLRLYPPVPVYSRNAEEGTTIGGYPLLKNSSVMVGPYLLHRNEELYPRAEIFDPTRFTPENSANRHLYSYLPFSAGSRNCIGQRFAMMEMKIIVANVLRKFSLKSLDPRDKILPTYELTLRPSKPVRIKFLSREEN